MIMWIASYRVIASLLLLDNLKRWNGTLYDRGNLPKSLSKHCIAIMHYECLVFYVVICLLPFLFKSM